MEQVVFAPELTPEDMMEVRQAQSIAELAQKSAHAADIVLSHAKIAEQRAIREMWEYLGGKLDTRDFRVSGVRYRIEILEGVFSLRPLMIGEY